MSTTINEVSKSLAKYKPKVSIQEDIIISNYYYLHCNFKNFNSNCLYVCESSKLPSNIASEDIVNLLIILDEPLPTYLQCWDRYNLILLDNNKCNIYSILENLQEFINKNSILNHLTNDLINAISKNSSLDELIKIAYYHLENPIIITNACRYICSSYTDNKNINEQVWQDYINNSYADSDYLKKLYYDINFRQSISFFNQPIIVDYYDIMNHRMLVCPIIRDDFNIAYIHVLEVNKPLSKIDTQILNILKKILIPIIIRDDRFTLNKNTPFDPLFYYLINQEDVDLKYINNYLKVFDLNLETNLFLIYIDQVDNMDFFENIKSLYDILNRLFYNHYIYLSNNKIYILYKDGLNLKTDEKNLFYQFLKENNLKASISQPFSKISDFKNAIYQADKALFMGKKLDPNKYIYYFSDYMVNIILFSFISHNNINDLIDLSFFDFIKSNNDELINTLKVYCENNGNIQMTSSKLHVHSNTLKYRLQKIKNLYFIDAFDKNNLIKLKLSFLAMEFLENKI